MTTALHVLAGLVALLAGAVALSAAKGSRLHRQGGLVFVGAMLLMTLSAFAMAAARLHRLNMLAAAVTFYLVATALLTVRRPAGVGRRVDMGLMLLAVVAGCAGIGLWVEAASRGKATGGAIYGVFGTVALLAALGDWRMLGAGAALAGPPRIVRHLWRMGLAMWVATASFFLGQAEVFPQALRGAVGLRSIPVVLVLGAVLYWLVRQAAMRRRLRPR
jgi:uncharacterized membrane protein